MRESADALATLLAHCAAGEAEACTALCERTSGTLRSTRLPPMDAWDPLVIDDARSAERVSALSAGREPDDQAGFQGIIAPWPY